MNWPQAKQKMSEKTKKYIRSLDAERDVDLLKKKFGRTIREEHFRILRISTMLLKKAAEADLTFNEIANLMCRRHVDEFSPLEKMCSQAGGIHKSDIVQRLSGLLDSEIGRIARSHSLTGQCEPSDEEDKDDDDSDDATGLS
jgi:hypothetical protein